MRKHRMKCRDGYTLVELITVLTIVSVLSAVVIPSLFGFIGKARERSLVAEAHSVCRSFQAYRIYRMEGEHASAGEVLCSVLGTDLSSESCPLHDYLTVTCHRGARIDDITLNRDGTVFEMVYLAGGCRIKIGSDHPQPVVEKIKSSGHGRLKDAKNLI